MKYVIECEGFIYGPFATDHEASAWALMHCSPPWRLRALHIIPSAADIARAKEQT